MRTPLVITLVVAAFIGGYAMSLLDGVHAERAGSVAKASPPLVYGYNDAAVRSSSNDAVTAIGLIEDGRVTLGGREADRHQLMRRLYEIAKR